MSFRIDMNPMAMIMAVDMSRGFGKEGKIPWNYPEDMKHFKEVTMGNICVMGRKTYTDMLQMVQERRRAKGQDPNDIKEILPGRQSFVVSNTEGFTAVGATVVHSLREAVQSLDEADERTVFVIGGRKMFIEALPWVDTLHLTLIKEDYDCDTVLPIAVTDYMMNNFVWEVVSKSDTNPLVFMKCTRKKEQQ